MQNYVAARAALFIHHSAFIILHSLLFYPNVTPRLGDFLAMGGKLGKLCGQNGWKLGRAAW